MVVMRITWILCVAAICLLAPVARGDDAAADAPPPAMLRLGHGEFVAGALKASETPNVVRWQSPAFTAPFEFAHKHIASIRFPIAEKRPQPTGRFCFELVSGDMLCGALVGFSKDEVELNVSGLGRLHVKRSHIQRMIRRTQGVSLVYLGPNSLAEWKTSGASEEWTEEGGYLETTQDGAYLHGKFDIPPQAAIEFEIAWTKKPNFVLALGVDREGLLIKQAFRFEVWDDDLVVMRETDDDVDVASVQKLKGGAGHVHLQAYLDQKRGQISIFSIDGIQLASLAVPNNKTGELKGVRLVNNSGNVRLEKLRIHRWNGEPPENAKTGKSRVHRSDGSILDGEITAFDASANQFLVKDGTAETRINTDDIEKIAFTLDKKTEPARTARIILQDGLLLSGTLNHVSPQHVQLTCPSITEELSVPTTRLRMLSFLGERAQWPMLKNRSGRLEMDGLHLHGCLIDGREESEASCLVWQPRKSLLAAPLRQGRAGQITYKDPTPPPKKKPRTARRRAPQRGFWGGFARAVSKDDPAKPRISRGRQMLYLRTGDTIPCEVTGIDERGLTIKSLMAKTNFIPHAKVKAIELAHCLKSIKVNRTKRERLLTLPRMQKNNPPTHLIRSIRGDILRGRLEEMNQETLVIEVRLEMKRIPREYVAQIIWLHGDELPPADEETTPVEQASPPQLTEKQLVEDQVPEQMLVQSLLHDKSRQTFSPKQVAKGVLSGESDVLGACQVEIKKIDQLYLGSAIQKATARLAYQRWKLNEAVQPRYITAAGSSGVHALGIESEMVGKPAPDFHLDLLDGKEFRLSEQKGKIIVLEFWATWCGPCIQGLPVVNRVTGEFADQNVRLVTVNLEESPKKITSTLERLKLPVTVALDQDGVAAGRYAATAIPQTVIIDREGKVARLFVGGGSHFEDQLRNSLKELLTEKASEEAAKQQ